MHIGGNDAKLTIRSSKPSTLEMKMLIDFIQRGISVYWLQTESLPSFNMCEVRLCELSSPS
jgi:hypothetical protein